MAVSLVFGSLLLVAGLCFMFFAIGIWVGNMRISPFIKQRRGNDVQHVLIFFVIGLLMDLIGTTLANAPIRFVTLPWYMIASSITFYFGCRTGYIH